MVDRGAGRVKERAPTSASAPEPRLALQSFPRLTGALPNLTSVGLVHPNDKSRGRSSLVTGLLSPRISISRLEEQFPGEQEA
jgi:hypothetical protein